MNVFWGLVFYVLIGGFVAVSMNNHMIEECDQYLDDDTVTLAVFGWPAIVPMGLLGETPSDYTPDDNCKRYQ